MEWSDQQLMRDIICVLATQGWEKIVEENLPLESVERLVAKFTIPLQEAQANCDKIKEEMQSLLQYAVTSRLHFPVDTRLLRCLVEAIQCAFLICSSTIIRALDHS